MKAIFSKDVTSEVRKPNNMGFVTDKYTLDSRTTTIRLFGIKVSEKKELFLHPYDTK